jgi:hypothetical protein
MTDELERRAGASPSGVFVCLFLAGVAFAMAGSEYLYVTGYDKMGGHPTFIYSRTVPPDLRRTPIGRVAEWGHPRFGRWGCVAVFATPGVAFLGATAWLLWRGRKRPGQAVR